MKNFPFHNSNAQPLPDANDIEREVAGAKGSLDKQKYDHLMNELMNEDSRRRFEADKRRLRNFLIGLLVTGLLIGGVLAIGLVWVMNQLNLIEPTPIEWQGDR